MARLSQGLLHNVKSILFCIFTQFVMVTGALFASIINAHHICHILEFHFLRDCLPFCVIIQRRKTYRRKSVSFILCNLSITFELLLETMAVFGQLHLTVSHAMSRTVANHLLFARSTSTFIIFSCDYLGSDFFQPKLFSGLCYCSGHFRNASIINSFGSLSKLSSAGKL